MHLPTPGRWVVGVLALSTAAGAAVLWADHPAAPTTGFRVRVMDLRSTIVLQGHLVPAVTWDLSFGAANATPAGATPAPATAVVGCPAPPPGGQPGPDRVTRVAVTVGQHVHRGQVLAQADTTALRTQITAATADLTQARALLDLHQTTTQPAAPTITPGPSAGAVAATRTPAPWALAQVGPDLDRIQHEAEHLATLQRAVDAAQITAPADAVVEQVDTVPGATSATQCPALVLRSTELHLLADVSLVQLMLLQPTQPAVVDVTGPAPQTATSVDTLPQATTGSGAGHFTLDLPLTDTPGGALPGMTATATITVAEHDHVLAVPTSALHHQEHTIQATRLDCANHPCRRQQTTVSTGITDGTMTEITTGLTDTDTVELPHTP